MILTAYIFCIIALALLVGHTLSKTQRTSIPYFQNVDQRWTHLLEESQQASPFRFAFNLSEILIGLATLCVAAVIQIKLLLVPIVGLLGIFSWVFYKKKYFLKSLTLQLEELFPFIYTSLKSGLTIDRALLSASQQFPNPASGELKKIIQAQQLGISLSYCLKLLSEKLQSEEVLLLSFALDLSDKTGTPLSHLMENIDRQIREKREFKRKVTALSSQGKAQGYVAMALPFLFLVAIQIVAPHVIAPLFEHPMGHFLLFACGFVMICASFLIYKITHFKGA